MWVRIIDTGTFSSLLLQCRYTLQYTYPYAYYMESGPRKKLVRRGSPSLLPSYLQRCSGSWEGEIKTVGYEILSLLGISKIGLRGWHLCNYKAVIPKKPLNVAIL